VKRPFVITIASEKGGVGKTTIATNLAVYLKALREDLPVTIASFDNHFSVDQMFVLGPRPEKNIAALLAGVAPADLVTLGQYGVQYIASSRRLTPPPHAPVWLQSALHSADFDGIIVLDTRPILDWFTEAALLAADLALVPVKDRAALVNADALRKILAAAGRERRLWLIPSLVDIRARLSAEVRVHEFLAYAARERDYQVLDICISKSPKVESLASGFSSSIRPVLTHARNTAVHGQLKALAEFVLARFDAQAGGPAACHDELAQSDVADITAGHRRLVRECPFCARQALASPGHFYFDLRSRRRGFIHPDCFERIKDDFNLEGIDTPGATIALALDGPGLIGPDCRLTAHLCDEEGCLIGSTELVLMPSPGGVGYAMAIMTGRLLDQAYRELILINTVVCAVEIQLADDTLRSFALRRRRIVRELRLAGSF